MIGWMIMYVYNFVYKYSSGAFAYAEGVLDSAKSIT